AADKWGRRPTIGFASILFALGSKNFCLLQSLPFLLRSGSAVLGAAINVEMLIVGRFVVGTGIGVAANIVPVYVAEVSPTKYRGSLVTVNNLCITSGTLSHH